MFREACETLPLPPKGVLRVDLIDAARSRFAVCAEKGVEYSLKYSLIEDSPKEIARFLHHCSFLDRAQIGEYLSEAKPKNRAVLQSYLELVPMEGVSLEAALRRLLARFKLPGEAQKIDRLMESFSLQYCRVNKKAFCKPESAYVLSFCIILLNTDLHNPNNNRRMTKEAFILNSQGTFNANDFSPTLLSEVYDAIQGKELMGEEDVLSYTLSAPDIEGSLWKKSDRFHSWNRRWCVVANGCFYYFYTKRDKSPRGVIPLEDLAIRPLNRKGRFRFEITAEEGCTSLCSPNEYSVGNSVTAANYTVPASLFALSSADGEMSTRADTLKSVTSAMTSPPLSFRSSKGTPLPIIKSAKFVRGQMVEGRRNRFLFQCSSQEERDRWVQVVSTLMQHNPVLETTSSVTFSQGNPPDHDEDE